MQAEVQAIKAELGELVAKFERFSENATRKLNYSADELCRLRQRGQSVALSHNRHHR